MTSASRSPRRGFSLIEAVVVISMTSILIVAGTSLILCVRKLQDRVQAARHNERVVRNLGNDFRHDLLRAQSADISRKSQLTVIDASGREIAYSQQGRTVHRTVRSGATVVGREAYPFVTDVRLEWNAVAGRPHGPDCVEMSVEVARGTLGPTSSTHLAFEGYMPLARGGSDET